MKTSTSGSSAAGRRCRRAAWRSAAALWSVRRSSAMNRITASSQDSISMAKTSQTKADCTDSVSAGSTVTVSRHHR